MVKGLFSKLLHHSGRDSSLKGQKFPAKLTGHTEILQTLNYALPDLQMIKLSIDSGQQDKAFEQFLHYMKTRPTPICNWGKRGDILHALREYYPETVSTLLKSADSVLQHQFLLFSKHRIHAETPIAWCANYDQDSEPDTRLWKAEKSYSRSRLIAETKGDIQFVWNLNRHQHFLDLGKAYWYTGEHEFVQEFITEITTWIDQNPYRQGVNWVDIHEIALRGIFWMIGAMFFFSSEAVDEAFFCRFYQYLLLHGHMVYDLLLSALKVLEPLHIVSSAAFLYMLGTVFPEYGQSKTWSKFGWELLQWNTKSLVLDEILQESLAALVSTIELYCLTLIVRRNHRFLIPQKVIEGLTTMLNQLSLFMKPNGTLTRMGEHAPVQLLRGMYTQRDDVRYLFAMAAALLKNESFKSLGETFEESLLWFFGSDGWQDFENLSAPPREQHSYLAPNGSYAVMRSGWTPDSGYCIIANNTLKTKRRHLLPHSDLLSVEVYANQHEILIDAGPYALQEEDEWTQYFSSVAAHNGVTVDRVKHLNFADHHVRGEFDQWISTVAFDFLSGYHTGFEDLEQPVTHRRSIFYWKPSYWIICDVLTGQGQHFYDQYFHFAPLRLNVDFSNKGVNAKVDEQHCLALLPIGTEDMDVMIFTGGDTPDSGWISDGYKHRVEAPFIKYGKQTQTPATFSTLLYTYEAEQMKKIATRHLHVSAQNASLLSDEAVAVEISVGDETHYFALRYKDGPAIQFENLTFQGALLFLRKQGEQALEFHLHNATLVKIGEQTLFESEIPVEGFSLRIADDTIHVSCAGNYTFRMQLPQIKHVLVNERRAFLKQQNDLITITTSRI